MNIRDLLCVPEADAGFETWVRKHQQGFVINADRNANVHMVWHQANCPHIQPDGATRWVNETYFKVCSTHPGALAQWAHERREAFHYCATCRDAWDRDH